MQVFLFSNSYNPLPWWTTQDIQQALSHLNTSNVETIHIFCHLWYMILSQLPYVPKTPKRKIKIKTRRRSLLRCHTGIGVEEKGSKLKMTFPKTKKECGAWLLHNWEELWEERERQWGFAAWQLGRVLWKQRWMVRLSYYISWRIFGKAKTNGAAWLLDNSQELQEDKDRWCGLAGGQLTLKCTCQTKKA